MRGTPKRTEVDQRLKRIIDGDIGKSKVKEKVHAPSSTQVNRLNLKELWES
jgi:hypothetical protein